MNRNYGFLGFGKKSPRDPESKITHESKIVQFIIVVAIGIALVSMIAGVISIWYPQISGVTQQIGMGVLILILIAAVLIPFTLIRRQFIGYPTKGTDLFFIILAVGVLIFLLVVTPKLFNLPEIFTVSRLELAQITQSLLGFP